MASTAKSEAGAEAAGVAEQNADGQPQLLLQKPIHQASSYDELEVCGFQVYFATDILLRGRLLRAIAQDLGEVRKVLPKAALDDLRGVCLYFNNQFSYGGQSARGMCVHWSPEWLRQNGNMPEKAGHIEVYSSADYLAWRSAQPACLLHELSHCYHQRKFESIDEEIKAAYNKVMMSGKYDKVKHIGGNEVEHYCKTNYMEYFAECSEAFSSSCRFRNDFYPFTNGQLKAYDRDGYAMVQKAWGVLPCDAATGKRHHAMHRKLGPQA